MQVSVVVDTFPDFAGRLIDVFMFFLDGQPFFDKHNIIFVVLVF
jgi:hypothetical protein